MLTRWRQANRWQREHERTLYGRNPSYLNFLRAIRDLPGFEVRAVALAGILAAAALREGWAALPAAGLALLVCATLGYLFWRVRVTRR